MEEDIELSSAVREAAKTEIRRREWASLRGKATRRYIRDHPEVVKEFGETSDISVVSFPPHVTRASVLLELRQRASRREVTKAVREWRKEHPEEVERLRREMEGR